MIFFLTTMTNLSAWLIFLSKKGLISELTCLITTFQKDLAYSVGWGTLKGRQFMGVFSALSMGRSMCDFMQFLVLMSGTRGWNKTESEHSVLGATVPHTFPKSCRYALLNCGELKRERQEKLTHQGIDFFIYKCGDDNSICPINCHKD